MVILQTSHVALNSKSARLVCELEMIFPPFFIVMVYLVMHLASETKVVGPVHYCWMYSIVR